MKSPIPHHNGQRMRLMNSQQHKHPKPRHNKVHYSSYEIGFEKNENKNVNDENLGAQGKSCCNKKPIMTIFKIE